MRVLRPRRRVSPSGWRALRREAHRFTNRQDRLSAMIVLLVTLGIGLCMGSTLLIAAQAGRFPPALQVIDDLRFNADYRRGSTFTAAALARNGRLWMGTGANGLFAYRTDSGWQGLWQQYTKASTGGGLVADSVQGLSADAQKLWVAVGGGLSAANLDATNWQILVGPNGFAPFGTGVAPNRARLSPDGRWLAVASADQGIGLYDTAQHDWQPITRENGLLPANTISALEFDSSGNLWVGTQGGLVSIQVGTKAARGPVAVELPGQTVVDLSFGADRIVALGADGSLFTLRAILAGSTWTAQGTWQQQASTSFTAGDTLAQDGKLNVTLAALTDTAVWVVTRTGTVGRYDLTSHDWRAQPVADKVKNVRDLVVSGETAYIAADVGLFRVSFSTPGGTDTMLTPAAVHKLALDGGRVWYLSDDAQVGYVDDGAEAPTLVRAGGRFGPDQGAVILADATAYASQPGELWMSVPGFGVGAYQLATHGWRSVSDGLPPQTAPRKLLTIGNGKTPAALVADPGNGRTMLYVYDGAAWNRISAPEQDITATAATSAGDGLWYKTADGAVYFTKGEPPDTAYFENAGPPQANNNPALAAAAATSSWLWLAQDKPAPALWQYNRQSHAWREFPQVDPFAPVQQLAAVGDTLYALSGGRLVTIGADGKANKVVYDAPLPLAADNKPPDQFVSAAVSHGSVWVAASDGRVFQYRPGVHTLKALSPEGAHVQVLQTTANSLWAMGGGSLYRFNQSQGSWSPVTGLTGAPRRIIPLKSYLAVNTDQDTLEWVSESGVVSSQSASGFPGLQDLTAISQAEDGRVWFGSAAHGIGIYQPDLHTWTVDSSVGPVRAIVAAQDGVSVATAQGIVTYPTRSVQGRKELDGDAQALALFNGHTMAMIAEPDGNALYRRESGGRWTLVRKSSAIPVDINTITAVIRAGNRFVFGTSAGKVIDYSAATGVWRTIADTLPVSRVDWIGLNGDLGNDARSATIWLVGPSKTGGDGQFDGQLVEIDTQGQVRQRSQSGQKVITASTGAGRVWYADATGGVFYLGENSASPVSLAGALAPVIPPTATSTPSATPTATQVPLQPATQPPSATIPITTGTPGGTPNSTPTVTPTLTLTNTLTPTYTNTPTATITFTPTLSIPQRLVNEPVKGLAINGDQFWLVTDRAIYLMRWNGSQLEPVYRTDSAKAVRRLRADDAGLLLAFDDNSAGRVSGDTGALTAVQGFDATVLYADSTWLWRQYGSAISVSLAGQPVHIVDNRLGFDAFQAMGGNGTELWIGGKGGASQIDPNGLITLYTQPGAVDGFRYLDQSWYFNQGALVRRFDATEHKWVDAAPADYAAPVTIATTGPIKWQVTDKGIVSDPPNPTTGSPGSNGSRFPFDTIMSLGLADKAKQLVARTGLGAWIISDPLARGEYTDAPDPGLISAAFSGTAQTNLGAGDAWHWTLTEDRATGNQSLDIALGGDPAIKRQIDPATGFFADDEITSLAADSTTLWIGTKDGLWHTSADASRDALYAPGQTVDTLRLTDAGLLAHLNGTGTPQLFDGKTNAFVSAPPGLEDKSTVLAKDDVLGPLLEQDPDGFSLPGFDDSLAGEPSRSGYWFDRVGALGAYLDDLWIVTPRGLVAYRLTDKGLVADRFDPSAQLGIGDSGTVTGLAVGPLDPATPDSPLALWALSAGGQVTAAFQNNQWKSAPYNNSPFAPNQRHTVTLPRDTQNPIPIKNPIQWTRTDTSDTSAGQIHASLDGRAFGWSNGRFDFDDIHDLAVPPGQVWLATAGGPFAIQTTSQCQVTNPTEGLATINLSRAGIGLSDELVVRNTANRDYSFDCQSKAWKPAEPGSVSKAFAQKMVALFHGIWEVMTLPQSDPVPPLGAGGVPESRLFTDNRFSFDVIRDTTISADGTLWLATAGGPLRVKADNGWDIQSDGLPESDSKAIRAETSGDNSSSRSVLRLSAGGGVYDWNSTSTGSSWTAETAPAALVTDARRITFTKGAWRSDPLDNPVLRVVGVADSDFPLFTPSGKFSFDDVHDVSGVPDGIGGTITLATAGGVVQGTLVTGALGASTLHYTQITARGLCGSPDGVRSEQGKLFVGYEARRTGQFLGDTCTTMRPWSHALDVAMPGRAPVTVSLSGSGLIGMRGSTPVFQFARTDQLLWVFGTWKPLDHATLIDVIDDGDQVWLVFDDNLVVLRKGELQRRGQG